MNETNVGVYSKEYSFLKLPYLFLLIFCFITSILCSSNFSASRKDNDAPRALHLNIHRDHDDLRRDIVHS